MANLKRIQEYLQRAKLPYKVVDLETEAFTVGDVVKAGIKEDEVVKTLVVRVNSRTDLLGTQGQTLNFVALALRGKDRLDFKKVRKLFGSKSELAKPEEVLKVIGVPIGAVCPVLVGIPLYLDKRVMDIKNVHMGSGDLMHGLEMKLSDLLLAVGDYKMEDLSLG